MPPRPSSRASTPNKGPAWTPANDSATHRDLLMFEERLKANAAMLKRRKSRYQVFLLIIIALFIVSALDTVLSTQILLSPANFLLVHLKPPFGPFEPIEPHPHFATAVCLTAGATLFLFFAGGVWAEKIGYANKYVAHANKTLRSFNMYLNVRPRPISSMWIIRVLRSSSSPPQDVPSPPITPTSGSFRRNRNSLPPISTISNNTTRQQATQSPSSPLSETDDSIVARAAVIPPSSRHKSGTGGTQITPIPPPTNPRGELIFNSRVDKSFRESYDRYRAAFERAKEDQKRRVYEERRAARRAWWSWLPIRLRLNLAAPQTPTSNLKGKEREKDSGSESSVVTVNLGSSTPTGSVSTRRGRLVRKTPSRPSTPGSSRKPSPAGWTASRRRSANYVDGLESVPERLPLEGDLLLTRTSTPTLRGVGTEGGADDESDASSIVSGVSSRSTHKPRRESFSFLLNRPEGLADDE